MEGKTRTQNRKLDGFNLMILVTSGWQTVSWSLACWKTLGQYMAMIANIWAMLAESWAIFRNVGKQLGC